MNIRAEQASAGADNVRQSGAGFPSIVAGIEERSRAAANLREVLTDILTLGGRQDILSGVQSLTPLQLALFEIGQSVPYQPEIDSERVFDREAEFPWFLGMWAYGRIWLAPQRPHSQDCMVFGAAILNSQQMEAVSGHAKSILRQWSQFDEELNRFYKESEPEELSHLLRKTHAAIDHIDPILVYVGDVAFTNFGKYNNLQERNQAKLPDCFFRRAERMALEDWTREERVFVYCFNCLLSAGCRGEEFNGRQLNPWLLANYFDRRLDGYASLLPQLAVEIPAALMEKARLLNRCKLDGSHAALNYRRINGLDFCKEERLLPRPLCPGIRALPARLGEFLFDTWGISAHRYESLSDLFDSCISHMAENQFKSGNPNLNAVEAVLKMLVDIAIASTRSDIGMTRGFRDIRRCHDAFAAARYEEICAWPTTDYFCGAFPSPVFARQFKNTPEALIRILCACSGRMQFNGWHYMPGHCPPEAVPAERHFYYPPRMADIAVWSDQHHAGHVMAEVRHSIRSPAPLEFCGRSFAGMLDLRLFRQQGPEYTLDEFREALVYTEFLRAFSQSLSDYVMRGGGTVCIEAFDKAWFHRFYGDLSQIDSDERVQFQNTLSASGLASAFVRHP